MAARRLASAIAILFALSVSAAAQVPNLRQTGPTLGPLPVEVPITQFTTGDAQCNTRARTATVALNAVLQPVGSQASGATATVDVLLDGVSVGVRTLPVRRSATITASPATIQISQNLAVPWSSGTKRVQFVVNGTHRTAERSFTYNCYRANAPTQQAPTAQVVLPDLAIDPIVVIYYDPPQPNYDGCWGAGRNTFGDCRILADYGPRAAREIPSTAVVTNELGGVVAIHRLTGTATGPCPTALDASVTITVAIAFTATNLNRPDGWGLPQGMIEEGFFTYPNGSDRVFTPGVAFLDSRLTTPQARPGYQNYPLGHEWAIFHRVLPCTNEGVFEFTLDPRNRLREANETNNTLRFRYRTARN